jgi:LmbE family N-acetylglucosaminyl deacetylase
MNILVLSPHTDDCELGCGGSLVKWKEEGHNIFPAVFSLCEESIPEGFDSDATYQEFLMNIKHYGFVDYFVYDFKVRNFPSDRQKILNIMVNLRITFEPNLVVGPSLYDTHQDHKTLAEEMQRAFRCSIISYELPYTTLNFNPQYYVPLEKKHIEKKRELIENYKSQLVKGKYSPELMESVARMRGSQIDKEFAEAFEIIRSIEK